MNSEAVRNNLMAMLDVEDEELLENIPKVVLALKLTWGLWRELECLNKGHELLDRCFVECNRMLDHCQHRDRLERLAHIKSDALEVAGLFIAAQFEEEEEWLDMVDRKADF